MKKSLKFGIFTLALCAFSFANAQEKKREKPSPEKVFKRIDADKNGEISLEEFKAKKMKDESKEAMMEKRFAKMDADGNKSLSMVEMKKAMEIMEKRKMKKQANKKMDDSMDEDDE
jgi:Ca2+-binding EF-hand superfamily protein